MKKILIVYQTHGNETIGKYAIRLLKKKFPEMNKFYDIIQGNPKASKLGVRYTECDLNRVSSENEELSQYENIRAAKLIKLFAKYEYVIDLHETSSCDEVMIIIPNFEKSHLDVCKFCPVDKVIIWPSTSVKKMNPLCSFNNKGFEIEIGTKNSFNEKIELISKVLNITINNIINNIIDNNNKTYYFVTGQILNTDLKNDIHMVDFEKYISPDDSSFYPLFFGTYAGKLGYKMQTFDFENM